MPELPEVETIRRGILPHILNREIKGIIVRERRLRWPVPPELERGLRNKTFTRLERRGKYLLFRADHGCLILHLGMSGSLRFIDADAKPGKHDHVDLVFTSGQCLRFHDPRRFGSIHWTELDPMQHPLLRGLGPEPLGNELDGPYLYRKSRNRKQPIKAFIMDSRIVTGIGNIYANEALFIAGIHPGRKAGRIAGQRYGKLVVAIRSVLQQALDRGGTTLRDFVDGEGRPGYFRQELCVYGRGNQPCYACETIIRQYRQGQRSTFFCPTCQT